MSGRFKQPKGAHPEWEQAKREDAHGLPAAQHQARHDRLVPHTPHARKGGHGPAK